MQKKISESFTLHDNMLFTASRFPGRIALIIEGRPYTYAELLNDSVRLAAAFRERGLGQGDLVAIYMDNTWPCVVSIWATILAGGVFLIINPQTKRNKLTFLLNDSHARLLVTDGHLSGMFLPALDKWAGPRHVICSGELPQGAPIESFNDVINNTPLTELTEESMSTDVTTISYVADSNGIPKGVPHIIHSVINAVERLINDLKLTKDDRILSVLPFASIFGLYQLLIATKLGATLVLERSLTYSARVFQRIEENHVTAVSGVPTVFELLLSASNNGVVSFASVTHLAVNAPPFSNNFSQRIRKIFPNAMVHICPDFPENSEATRHAIVTRGEYVNPIEVENTLRQMPGVLEASVTGVPDSLMGEAIRAHIVIERNADWTARSLRAACMTQMENFMVPREIIICLSP